MTFVSVVRIVNDLVVPNRIDAFDKRPTFVYRKMSIEESWAQERFFIVWMYSSDYFCLFGKVEFSQDFHVWLDNFASSNWTVRCTASSNEITLFRWWKTKENKWKKLQLVTINRAEWKPKQ